MHLIPLIVWKQLWSMSFDWSFRFLFKSSQALFNLWKYISNSNNKTDFYPLTLWKALHINIYSSQIIFEKKGEKHQKPQWFFLVFSSTGQRPEELMPWCDVCRLCDHAFVRPCMRPSINNCLCTRYSLHFLLYLNQTYTVVRYPWELGSFRKPARSAHVRLDYGPWNCQNCYNRACEHNRGSI